MRIRRLIPLLLLLLLCSPLTATWRSMAVMYPVQRLQQKESLLTRLPVEIPSGRATPQRDWYPLMLCHHSGTSFGASLGRNDLSLTVLYNFGAFARGRSTLYAKDSPYYSSFYGAYLVESDSSPYGFIEDGAPDCVAIASIAEYDWYTLVLRDFGLAKEDFLFDWELLSAQDCPLYAGVADWTRLDVRLVTNGAGHCFQHFVPSYLQYGKPSDCDDPFAPLTLYGRIYARYFPTEEISVFFYLLCPDAQTLEACDSQLLSQSRIEPNTPTD